MFKLLLRKFFGAKEDFISALWMINDAIIILETPVKRIQKIKKLRSVCLPQMGKINIFRESFSFQIDQTKNHFVSYILLNQISFTFNFLLFSYVNFYTLWHFCWYIFIRIFHDNLTLTIYTVTYTFKANT
jgi:hypothetical protein